GFLNAPEATLHGVELEVKKYFDPEAPWPQGGRPYFAPNYTWARPGVNAGEDEPVVPPGFNRAPPAARSPVRDRRRAQGPSEHIGNVQFGVENEDADLQATLVANYVSERISVRGRAGQPDYIEEPGTTLDLVVRKGLDFGYRHFKPSVRFSARNLLDTRHEE